MTIFQKPPSPYDLSDFTIMIVEDSNYMQSLMVQMLKAFGVGEILACSGGKEAMEILNVLQARKQTKFFTSVDIVLTDWLMPKGSGEELLRWIRGHENNAVRYLPVVVISGYTTEYIATYTRDLGANETLVKPVSASGLASRICNVIDHPRPFIDASGYFGPDRRRQKHPFNGPDRRQQMPEEVKLNNV